ncbi:hypothetical protein [Larkinella ripae]
MEIGVIGYILLLKTGCGFGQPPQTTFLFFQNRLACADRPVFSFQPVFRSKKTVRNPLIDNTILDRRTTSRRERDKGRKYFFLLSITVDNNFFTILYLCNPTFLKGVVSGLAASKGDFAHT